MDIDLARHERRLVRSSVRSWVAAGMLGVAAGWGMMALTPWFALVLVGSAIAAGLDSIGTVAGYGLIQRRTPDAVSRSRLRRTIDGGAEREHGRASSSSDRSSRRSAHRPSMGWAGSSPSSRRSRS